MEWYHIAELTGLVVFLVFTIIGGSFVIVTQIKKPYVQSSKVNPLIIQLFVSAEIIVIQGTFLIVALINDNQLFLHRHVCMLNDALVTLGLSAHSFTILLAAVDRLILISKPLRYNELTRKQVIIPGVIIAGFVSMLSWSWKLSTQQKFNINLEYISFLGLCHVDIEACFSSEEPASFGELTEHNNTEKNTVDAYGATNMTFLSEAAKVCIHRRSYSDLCDVCFGLGVYLPVVIALVIFGGSYRQFQQRCEESSNTRRTMLMGRKTIRESIIFNNRSVRLGGEEAAGGKSKQVSLNEIELKDYRPKSGRLTLTTNDLKMSGTVSTLQDNSCTIADAVRDENESKLSPRAHVILFQEGPSIPAEFLVDHSPNLDRLSAQILNKPDNDEEGDEAPRKKVFRNNITQHQLATTCCLMVTTIFSFMLLTIYMALDIAFRENTGIHERHQFPLSIIINAIGFIDFMVVGVFNSYVRKDVVSLFQMCFCDSDI